jgi:hypothetical protein
MGGTPLAPRPLEAVVTDQDLPAIPDDAANPPAHRPTLSRVEVLAGALAVLGAGVATLAVLAARSEPAAGAVATAAAVSAPSRAHPPAAMMTRSGPGWTANDARWVGNARKSVAFELPAHNKVSVWMREVRPLLVVRCIPGGTDVFVYTESAAMIEPQTEDHTVRFAFDDEQEVRELWPDSAEHDALFAPDGAAFARRLKDVSTFRFGFTPHNAAPVTAHFQVSGLRERLAPVAKACGSTRD